MKYSCLGYGPGIAICGGVYPQIATSLLLLASIGACSSEIGASGGGDKGVGTADAGGTKGDDPNCARVELDLSSEIPTVLLVVDRSGSMDDSFGNTDRWNATYETLMDDTTGVVQALQGQVRFGLSLYTSIDGFSGGQGLDGQPAGTCPMLTEVAPSLDNHAAIDAAYSLKGPVEDTPTGAALVQAKATLEQIAEPGPKVIVLATDGLPDSCTYPDPSNDTQRASARNEAIDAATSAFGAGVSTFVISVGNDVAQGHLQDMANAGTGLAVGGGNNAPYYRALNPSELVGAFSTIIAGVRSCELSIDGQVNPSNAEGKVELNGRELVENTDWQILDSTTIELLGAACDELKSPGDHSLRADFSCGSVID